MFTNKVSTYIIQNIKITIQLSTKMTGLQKGKTSLRNKLNGHYSVTIETDSHRPV